MKAYTRSGVKEISMRHGFRRADSLGQNFLVDKNIIDKIVAAADLDQETLAIEVGPGMGALTVNMAEEANQVIAVEIDSHLLPVLNETLGHLDNVQVINQDILKTDVNEIIGHAKEIAKKNGESIKKVVIVGNLPYYITTPIIMSMLENEVDMSAMVVMMQKEVAERIVAKPGSKTYGALSVACQFYCETSYVTTVPKTVFQPQPKVDSAVLKLSKREILPWDVADRQVFFKVVRAGFNQRRKTLLNSVSAIDGLSKIQLAEILDEVGIDARRRAETLSIEEFALIANKIHCLGVIEWKK